MICDGFLEIIRVEESSGVNFAQSGVFDLAFLF